MVPKKNPEENSSGFFTSLSDVIFDLSKILVF